jgi:hypothetical protein
VLAQHDVDQGAITIDRAVEIFSTAVRPDVRLVDVPAPPNFALSSLSEILAQCRRELGFPVANRLVAEHEAADQEHLGQIPQAQFVAQSPEHHEGDDVTRVLRPVQQAGATLVELLRAAQSAEPAIALRRALGPFPAGCRLAFRAAHPASPQSEGGIVAMIAGDHQPAGAIADRTFAVSNLHWTEMSRERLSWIRSVPLCPEGRRAVMGNSQQAAGSPGRPLSWACTTPRAGLPRG